MVGRPVVDVLEAGHGQIDDVRIAIEAGERVVPVGVGLGAHLAERRLLLTAERDEDHPRAPRRRAARGLVDDLPVTFPSFGAAATGTVVSDTSTSAARMAVARLTRATLLQTSPPPPPTGVRGSPAWRLTRVLPPRVGVLGRGGRRGCPVARGGKGGARGGDFALDLVVELGDAARSSRSD